MDTDLKDTISVKEQCEILNISRTKTYYNPAPKYSEDEILIMKTIDKTHTELPFYGYRRMHKELINNGFEATRYMVLKLMQVMGMATVYPKRKTTIRDKEHKVYPYLLKYIKLDAPNQAWSTDITYIRMMRGFCYLVAVIDCYSRKILSYRVSNTMDTDFCLKALEDALAKNPKPMVFNTDQGCQFTSKMFTEKLKENNILISMDSKGRATDNAIIERFWRSIKYEDIYLKEYMTITEVREGVKRYLDFYNEKRLHSSLDYQTPSKVYANIRGVIVRINDSGLINGKQEWKSIA